MALIETWLNCDTTKLVTVKALDGNVFSADNEGNLLGVYVSKKGQPVELSGSVIGYVIRPDGETVAVPGSLSGNRAWIVLPQSAYAVVGQISIAIRLVNGSEKTVLAACTGYVNRTTTDTIIDPGHVIPSLEELLAQIEACETATTAATAAAGAANTAASNANTKAALANTAAGNADAKATLANTAAGRADDAAAALENMTGTATGLAAGEDPTVNITKEDGHYTIEIGVPKGDTGEVAQAEFDDLNETVSDLKSTISSILEDQVIYAYSGNVSGTRQVNVTGLNIPAGTYIFSASVTSTDTDDTTCRVIFVKNNTTVENVYAQRIPNYSTAVTLTDHVDEIRFFAANSYNNGAGDTFSFSNIKLYEDTNLRKELASSVKYIGISNDVGLTDANNAIKGSIYNIANGVSISNLPTFSTEGVLITTGGTYPVQLFFVDGVFYKRYYRGSTNGWTAWATDSTLSSAIIFKGRSNSVGLTNADNAEKNSIYNTAGTVVMTNLPYSANEGVLLTTGGDYPVQLYFVDDGFYKRYYRGSNNGWSAWVNTGIEIETTPSNLIDNLKTYNGTGVTLRLSNETFDIISIYKAYYGNDWFDNYTGWNGNPDPFTRGLYCTGIKIKGRANTKFVMSADTGNTNVKTHFSIFAPYTNVTLEDITIDIGTGYCRYCIHDDFAPQNCKMIYKNLVMRGSSYSADALYGMGCGSNVEYNFKNCWMISGTNRAWYGHSAPNQTAPCIVKISNCVTYQNVGFKWYSSYSGMNIGYVDKSVQNVSCDAYYDAQTVNFNVYHDTGSAIEVLPTT